MGKEYDHTVPRKDEMFCATRNPCVAAILTCQKSIHVSGHRTAPGNNPRQQRASGQNEPEASVVIILNFDEIHVFLLSLLWTEESFFVYLRKALVNASGIVSKAHPISH